MVTMLGIVCCAQHCVQFERQLRWYTLLHFEPDELVDLHVLQPEILATIFLYRLPETRGSESDLPIMKRCANWLKLFATFSVGSD